MEWRAVVELLVVVIFCAVGIGFAWAWRAEKKALQAARMANSDAYVKGWLGAELKRMRSLSDDALLLEADRALKEKQ